MLDLYNLRIFEAVVQAGSFSAAAEKLYITQSAVSQHIKDLEISVGQPLFHRGWRGVSLTSQGEVLSQYTRQVFDLVAQAENALINVDTLSAGKINLGTTSTIGIYLAPDWVQHFRVRYPQLTVVLQTGDVAQIAADVLSHRLDIGIIEGDTPAKLAHLMLEEIEEVVVAGTAHPLAQPEKIQMTDLHQQSFIMQPPHNRRWLDQTLAYYGIEPMIGAEFDNLESIKRTLAVGRCVSVLPYYVIQNEVEQGVLRVISVEGQPFKRQLNLIWDRNLPFTPITRAFLKELSQRYPGLKAIT